MIIDLMKTMFLMFNGGRKFSEPGTGRQQLSSEMERVANVAKFAAVLYQMKGFDQLSDVNKDYILSMYDSKDFLPYSSFNDLPRRHDSILAALMKDSENT